MIRRLTADDLAAEIMRAKLYRDHFNSWLDGSGLAVMLVEGNFNPTPPVTICAPNVGLGEEYDTCFRSWFKKAVTDLVKACDRDGKRFTYGSLGSMWMDATLTGQLPDGTSKAKEVRIALMPKEPAVLAPKTNAIRVVACEAKLVSVTKPGGEPGTWAISGGDQVPAGQLFPMHALTDSMQYLMMFDPTIDEEETF